MADSFKVGDVVWFVHGWDFHRGEVAEVFTFSNGARSYSLRLDDRGIVVGRTDLDLHRTSAAAHAARPDVFELVTDKHRGHAKWCRERLEERQRELERVRADVARFERELAESESALAELESADAR